MTFESYHQAIWENVPEGLDPPHARLRGRFLLAGVRALARETGAPPRNGPLARKERPPTETTGELSRKL